MEFHSIVCPDRDDDTDSDEENRLEKRRKRRGGAQEEASGGRERHRCRSKNPNDVEKTNTSDLGAPRELTHRERSVFTPRSVTDRLVKGRYWKASLILLALNMEEERETAEAERKTEVEKIEAKRKAAKKKRT
ncbi:hypothetical protein BDR06DRAFT_1012870 [Suillus hirtellus]|nr:hypothetical protein BDR06DRAFT_1012870 [Suillus hirtellus]